MTNTITALLTIYTISLVLCVWFVFGYFRSKGVSAISIITAAILSLLPGVNTFAVLVMAFTFFASVKNEMDRQADIHERVMMKTKKRFG